MSAEIDVLEQMVQRSHSPDAEVRNAALKEIVQLPDEALLQIVANRSQSNRATSRRLLRRTLNALPYALFALAIIVALCKDPSADPRLKWVPICLIIGMLGLMLGVSGSYLRSRLLPDRRRGEEFRNSGPLPCALVLLLTGRTDKRFLPYLLSEIGAEFPLFERARAETDMFPPALPLGNVFNVAARLKSPFPNTLNELRHRYRRLLKGMLAQIGPEDEIDLSPEQRHALLLLLQIPEEDVDLTVCILAHLEQWGEARSVPALKRLIREEHWYVGSDRVEAAARQCLEQVEARVHQRIQSDTLLRPIHSTESTAPQTLLRSAIDPPVRAPEHLLRPDPPLPPDTRT